MILGLVLSILPGFATARRIDTDGDAIRHFMLAPALGLLILLGISGIAFFFGLTVENLTILFILVNIIAFCAIRTELLPIHEPKIIQRTPWFWIFTLIAIYIALTPLSYYSPMGVDWIGFTFLADSFASNASFSIAEPSSGYWIYPPAFPVLAAWLGGEIYLSVFILGVLCFASLLLAIAAIGEKMGHEHWVILAMLLAPALFAKNLDSGFPTVASQLGLVVILLMANEKLRWGPIALTSLAVLVIHPTGFVYLITFVFAKLAVEKSDRITLAEKIQMQILVISIILLTIISATQFDGDAIFAEYGWQGGSPMILYSGLLLPLGVWAAWSMKSNMQARVFIAWAILNWLVTLIHLFDGITGFAIFSMLSYVMYSMSMHAFHIPLAILVGMRLSKIENGIASDGGRAIMIAALLISGVAHSALSELSEHTELQVISEGDITLISILDDLPENSIIYTENDHWGHLFSVPDGIGVTAIPTLGILKQEHSIQNAATTAIIYDNIERLNELGITHAFASPKGMMMHYLSASIHWKKIWESQASTLYSLQDDNLISEFIPVDGDNMRIDPWAKLRSLDPFSIGDKKHFISEGVHNFAVDENDAYMVCIMLEFVGDVNAEVNDEEYSGSGWHNICSVAGSGGFEISFISDREYWINPLGASGRGDALIDTTGIRIHWIETIYLA